MRFPSHTCHVRAHALLCWVQEALETAVAENGGFRWVNERPDATTRGQQK